MKTFPRTQRTPSVVERITTADVLRLAKVQTVVRGGRAWFRCGSHADDNPSAVVVGASGWKCHACGAKGGILDLVVALGLAPNRAAAARLLEERVR